MIRKGKRIRSFFLALLMIFTSFTSMDVSVMAAKKEPTKLILNDKSANTYVGGSVKLKVSAVKPQKASKAVRWISSNKRIATVSSSGVVKAKKAGTVTITARSKISPKVAAKCKIKVYKATKKIKLLSKKSYTLDVGETVTLKAKATSPKKGAQPIQWKSNDRKVAIVSAKGKVTAVSKGTTTITGRSGKVKVQVKIEVKRISTPTSPPISELDPETGITRAEWVAILTDKMGYSVKAENLTQNPGTKEVLYEYDDIAGHKYAMKIEAAYCYGIIPPVDLGDGKAHLFKPDAFVTREFAALTAVRALGIASDEALESSDSKLLAYPNEDKTAVDIGMFSLKGSAFVPDGFLSKEEKDKVLSVMDEILRGREVDETHKDVLSYADEANIRDWSDIGSDYALMETGNGSLSLSVPNTVNTSGIKTGNIIVLPQSREYPAGMYFKVTETGTDKNGVTELAGVVPELYEVFSTVDIEGYAGAYLEGIIPAEGVDFTYVDKPAAAHANRKGISSGLQDIDLGAKLKITIKNGKVSLQAGAFEAGSLEWEASKKSKKKLDISGERGLDYEASVEVQIPKVKYNIDMDVAPFSLDLRQLYLELDNSITFSVGVMGDAEGGIKGEKVDRVEIPIGIIPIPITAGFAVNMGMSVVLGAEGHVSLSYTLNGLIGVHYIDGKLMKICEYSGGWNTMKVEAEVNAGLKPTFALEWAKAELVVFSVECGAKANIKLEEHYDVEDPPLVCVNVDLWLYLDLAVETGEFFEHLNIKFTKTWHAWDEDSSPLKKIPLCHLENGELVDECTYGTVILSGIVKDEKGNIVPGCTVTISVEDRVVARLLTKIDGSYYIILPKLSKGKKYNVSFNIKDYEDVTEPVIEDPGHPGETDVSVTLTPRSGEYHGIKWSVDENGRLTLQGKCTEKISWNHAPWYEYHTEICSAKVAVTGLTDMGNMFQYYERLRSVDFTGTDTKDVTSMSYMFDGCTSLLSLDLSSFDTGNVTDMSDMFRDCRSLTRLDVSSFNTKNVTRTAYMFLNCSSLSILDVGSFDTGNVTDMSHMFDGCSSLQRLDLSGFNTRGVGDMCRMFSGCSNLADLNLSGFHTENVRDMGGMFGDCSSLTDLDLSSFDTGNVTNMGGMFNECRSLRSLDLSSFKTEKVTNMASMFCHCHSLEILDISSFDTRSVDTVAGYYWIFDQCSNLRTVYYPSGWPANIAPRA